MDGWGLQKTTMKNKTPSNVIPFKKEDREMIVQDKPESFEYQGFGDPKYKDKPAVLNEENSLVVYILGENHDEGVYLDMFIDGKRQDVRKRKKLLVSIIETLVNGFTKGGKS